MNSLVLAFPDIKTHPMRVIKILTLVLLIIHSPGYWYVEAPVKALCVLGLLSRSISATAWYWFTLSCLLGSAVFHNWEAADNHKYLMAYWCFAIACVSSAQQLNPAILRANARWLIGLCMLFATFWKLISPTYMSGSFFEYTLLTDSRFATFTSWASGIELEKLKANREQESTLKRGHLESQRFQSVRLNSSPRLKKLAWFMTFWTILIEGSIAIVFLLNSSFCRKVRDPLLLFFALSTYAVATVKGFAWLLLVMGVAQVEDKNWHYRYGYFGVFVLVQFYTLPWGDIIGAIMN